MKIFWQQPDIGDHKIHNGKIIETAFRGKERKCIGCIPYCS